MIRLSLVQFVCFWFKQTLPVQFVCFLVGVHAIESEDELHQKLNTCGSIRLILFQQDEIKH